MQKNSSNFWRVLNPFKVSKPFSNVSQNCTYFYSSLRFKIHCLHTEHKLWKFYMNRRTKHLLHNLVKLHCFAWFAVFCQVTQFHLQAILWSISHRKRHRNYCGACESSSRVSTLENASRVREKLCRHWQQTSEKTRRVGTPQIMFQFDRSNKYFASFGDFDLEFACLQTKVYLSAEYSSMGAHGTTNRNYSSNPNQKNSMLRCQFFLSRQVTRTCGTNHRLFHQRRSVACSCFNDHNFVIFWAQFTKFPTFQSKISKTF